MNKLFPAALLLASTLTLAAQTNTNTSPTAQTNHIVGRTNMVAGFRTNVPALVRPAAPARPVDPAAVTKAYYDRQIAAIQKKIDTLDAARQATNERNQLRALAGQSVDYGPIQNLNRQVNALHQEIAALKLKQLDAQARYSKR